MNIDKLKNVLNFRATSIQEAFEETVEFYEQARFVYAKERIRIEKELKKNFFKKKNEAERFSEFLTLFNKS